MRGSFLHPPQVTAGFPFASFACRELRAAARWACLRIHGGHPASVSYPPAHLSPGLPRGRDEGRVLEPWAPWNAPSSPGDLKPCLLVASAAFLASLSHDNSSLHAQTLLHCLRGANCPGPQVCVSTLTPLALASCWISQVKLGKEALLGPFLR